MSGFMLIPFLLKKVGIFTIYPRLGPLAAFVFVINLIALEGTKKLEPHRVISILDY